MKMSRSEPNRPCLRKNPYGGSELWFTSQPESMTDYYRMDEDVSSAVDKMRSLLISSLNQKHKRKERHKGE